MIKNKVTGAINCIAMLLSIPIIGTGIWLSGKQDNECVKFLQGPVIAIGVLLFLVGLSGFIGAFWNIRCLLVLYLVFMFILLVLLMALVIFVFRVTDKGHGHTLPNRAYRQYNLYDFSGWLRRRVQSSGRWNHIRNCLSSSTTCSRLKQRFTFAQDFFNGRIGPLESGCCTPPTECGYAFVTPVFWITPVSQDVDSDCPLWNNEQTQLCYSCNSCKGGLLASLKREWRKANIVLLIILVALIGLYVAFILTYLLQRRRRLQGSQQSNNIKHVG
uniref:Uncharacterized protein n=1 Tax=Picea sitchensis TaxID=3332 RepID=A9NTZ1_PICSI|nr:unknown [Picea sitchensis]